MPENVLLSNRHLMAKDQHPSGLPVPHVNDSCHAMSFARKLRRRAARTKGRVGGISSISGDGIPVSECPVSAEFQQEVRTLIPKAIVTTADEMGLPKISHRLMQLVSIDQLRKGSPTSRKHSSLTIASFAWNIGTLELQGEFAQANEMRRSWSKLTDRHDEDKELAGVAAQLLAFNVKRRIALFPTISAWSSRQPWRSRTI